VHLSQSATSGALARLREVFQDQLLVPVGRKLVLTPVAEALVDPVRDFLLQAEAILNSNPVFDPASSTRKFRLLMSDYVEMVLMTEVPASHGTGGSRYKVRIRFQRRRVSTRWIAVR
jgi:Transcriptional regulator